MYNDELKHYGVAGMKWGVRRAARAYGRASASGNKSTASRALAALDKHRAKSSDKISKLKTKNSNLEVKAANLMVKSNKYKQKAAKPYLTDYGYKASKRNALKATRREGKALRLQQKIAKNKQMQDALKKGIKDIDATKAKAGKDYLKAYSKENRRIERRRAKESTKQSRKRR